MIGPFRSSIATGIRAVPRGFDPARIPKYIVSGCVFPKEACVQGPTGSLLGVGHRSRPGLRHRSGRAFAHGPVVRPEQPAYRDRGASWSGSTRSRCRSTEKADLILVTHDHGDHYSPADIKKLSGPSTIVLVGFDGSSFARITAGRQENFRRPVHRGLARLQHREDAVPPQVRRLLRLHPLRPAACASTTRATPSGSPR